MRSFSFSGSGGAGGLAMPEPNTYARLFTCQYTSKRPAPASRVATHRRPIGCAPSRSAGAVGQAVWPCQSLTHTRVYLRVSTLANALHRHQELQLIAVRSDALLLVQRERWGRRSGHARA